MTRRLGRSRRHVFSSMETAVVLPTPVEPTTAKCRVTSSLTFTVAGIVSF